jgi:hypothetical protein
MTPEMVLKHTRSPEYRAAARYLAQRHLTGKLGDPLPLNMRPETVREINSHLAHFQMLVSAAHKALFGY